MSTLNPPADIMPSAEDSYLIFGNPLSYFTRKLEAAMRFYGAPHQLRAKTPDIAGVIETRSGTHQVPVLLTPENWMIADTTPLIALLDGRYPDRRLFPAGLTGVLTHILEDFFDEWIARTMVHYRWHYTECAEFAAARMAGGNAEVAARLKDWGPRACRATGTDSPVQQDAAEQEYRSLLEAMESQLADSLYLLGDRPTALDAVVLGGLRAHTNADPVPARLVNGFPRVKAWCETGADRWDGRGELGPFPEPTSFAARVLDIARTTYVPFILGNQRALAAGAKAFQADIYGESVSYLCRPYPETARRMIANRIETHLNTGERQALKPWLQARGLDTLWSINSQ